MYEVIVCFNIYLIDLLLNDECLEVIVYLFIVRINN